MISMEDLPEQCLQDILGRLTHESLIRTAATCRRMHGLVAGMDSCEGEQSRGTPACMHACTITSRAAMHTPSAWATKPSSHLPPPPPPPLPGMPIKAWEAMAAARNGIACGSWRDGLMLAARDAESHKQKAATAPLAAASSITTPMSFSVMTHTCACKNKEPDPSPLARSDVTPSLILSSCLLSPVSLLYPSSAHPGLLIRGQRHQGHGCGDGRLVSSPLRRPRQPQASVDREWEDAGAEARGLCARFYFPLCRENAKQMHFPWCQ